MNQYLSVAFLPVVAWIIHKAITARMKNRRIAKSYPPGPKPKPIIANLLDFPLEKLPMSYRDMSKTYGSNIIHFEAMGNHVVILNKFEDAEELLEKRAKIYSSRPPIPIVELLNWEYNIALMPHNNRWRSHRKICQQNFRAEEAVKYLPIQMEKISEMLRDLVETSEQFDLHNKKLSISIPLSTMYGYDITSLDDPVIVAADKGITLGTALLVPGSTFINIFPILGRMPTWFPGAQAVRVAAEVKKLTAEMKRIPMEFAKKMIANGTARPSLVTDFLEKKWRVGASEEEEEIIENIANTVYGAASDTTISATSTFFYLLATNPDAQRKAQEELDRVVGHKRLPEISDRPNLPYIEAIYREVLRIGPPLPLGLPHELSEDDYYAGYFLPKGTSFIANVWAMNHDEEKYDEPYKFKPERFFDEFGNINNDDRILAYGFGRRICVGKHVANSTLWLIIASVLACFNINKSKDEHGHEIEIDDEFEEFGVVRHKAKFRCSFEVRFDEIRQLISATRHE